MNNSYSNGGIPEYNALLDKNLGTHRKFLLGSRKSLVHLKKTGCISGAKRSDKSENKWAIKLNVKKNGTKLNDKDMSKHASEDANGTYKKRLSYSASVPSVRSNPVKLDKSANEFNDTTKVIHSDEQAQKIKNMKDPLRSLSLTKKKHPLKMLNKQRQVEPIISCDNTKILPVLKADKLTSQVKPRERENVIDKLLCSDKIYRSKIQKAKDEQEKLSNQKKTIDSQIANLRKRISGINAVQENDNAVAHCLSIMNHRIAKSEEEYMRILTNSSTMKKNVDFVRMELQSIDKVKKQVENELEIAHQKFVAMQNQANSTREKEKHLSAQLSKLERKAEIDSVDRILKLPEDDGAQGIDISTLMKSVYERDLGRKSLSYEEKHSYKLQLARNSVNSAVQEKNLQQKDQDINKFRNVFDKIKDSLGCENLDDFVQNFVSTETELLSLYKHNIEIIEDNKVLQAKLKNYQNSMEELKNVSSKMIESNSNESDLITTKIKSLENEEKKYRLLFQQLNCDYLSVRTPLIRILETLQAEKNFENGISPLFSFQDLSSPELLGHIQNRVVDLVILDRVEEGINDLLDNNTDNKLSMRNRNLYSDNVKISLGPQVPGGKNKNSMNVHIPPIESLSNILQGNHEQDIQSPVNVSDNSIPISANEYRKKLLEKANANECNND